LVIVNLIEAIILAIIYIQGEGKVKVKFALEQVMETLGGGGVAV
jgi:hypothetical protein